MRHPSGLPVVSNECTGGGGECAGIHYSSSKQPSIPVNGYVVASHVGRQIMCVCSFLSLFLEFDEMLTAYLIAFQYLVQQVQHPLCR